MKWEFERPGDRDRWWVREQLYTIQPKAPLSESVFRAQWGEAVLCIGDDLKFPDSRGFSVGFLNGYTYLSPIKVTDGDEIAARLSHFEARIRDLSDNLDRDLAEYHRKQDLEKAYWAAIDLSAASLMDLLEHWRHALLTQDLCFKLHFLIAFPRHVVAGMMAHQAEDLAGLTDPAMVAKLTQGLGPTRQLELDMALWSLAGEAITAGLDDLFTGADILQALEGSGRAASWLGQFHQFLEKFGARQVMPLDLIDPTLIEDPASVLKTIASYIAKGGAYDFQGIERDRALERDRLVAETLAKVADATARDDLARLMVAARKFQAAMEDDNYYLLWAISQVRWVAMEIGRRLARGGVLEDAEDIHFLKKDELEAALVDHAIGLHDQSHIGPLVADRRALWQAQMAAQPPEYIGDFPDQLDDFILNNFWGILGRRHLDAEAVTVSGLGASRGIVEGIARHVGDLEDFASVAADDIIICRSTNPAWTPLFSKIAAVVTDQGGTLCHAAIVAREYGIPAVLGTVNGTRTIPDGARIRVDGTEGSVEIL